MNVEFAQIFTQILSFLIILWVMKRFAWQPFLKILDDREKKIHNEYEAIENTKLEVNLLRQRYEEQLRQADAMAKGIIKEAQDSGLNVAKKIENSAHAEARRILAQAQEELKREIIQAKSQLKNELVDITLLATEKMLKTQLDHDKQKSLLKEFIDKAGVI